MGDYFYFETFYVNNEFYMLHPDGNLYREGSMQHTSLFPVNGDYEALEWEEATKGRLTLGDHWDDDIVDMTRRVCLAKGMDASHIHYRGKLKENWEEYDYITDEERIRADKEFYEQYERDFNEIDENY